MSHIEHQVPRRYAHALFNVAKNKGIIDQISNELAIIRSIITADDSLIGFLSAPQVTDENKFQLVEDVFKKRFSDLIYHFVKLTIEKRRSPYLLGIINEFTALVEEARGILRVKMTTAIPMDLPLRDELSLKLAKLTGKTINIYPEIDQSIIGGVVINMNNQVIDDSVRHKLDLMRNQLLSLKVH